MGDASSEPGCSIKNNPAPTATAPEARATRSPADQTTRSSLQCSRTRTAQDHLNAATPGAKARWELGSVRRGSLRYIPKR